MPPDKQFLIIAYDIVCTRRRNRLVKLLEEYGRRANYSVFECQVKKQDIGRLKEKIRAIIDSGADSVLYYPLCRSCVDHREEDGFRRTKSQKTGNLIL